MAEVAVAEAAVAEAAAAVGATAFSFFKATVAVTGATSAFAFLDFPTVTSATATSATATEDLFFSCFVAAVTAGAAVADNDDETKLINFSSS